MNVEELRDALDALLEENPLAGLLEVTLEVHADDHYRVRRTLEALRVRPSGNLAPYRPPEVLLTDADPTARRRHELADVFRRGADEIEAAARHLKPVEDVDTGGRT